MASLGHSRLAYLASFVAVVVGLVVLLVAEFLGIGRTVVVAGGALSVVGVAVLTAAVASVPKPEGSEH
jgi:hypothetical protein